MAVRREAPIELPHIMVLIDYPERTVIEPLTEKKSKLKRHYSASLMEQGGQVDGWAVTGAQQEEGLDALGALAAP